MGFISDIGIFLLDIVTKLEAPMPLSPYSPTMGGGGIGASSFVTMFCKSMSMSGIKPTSPPF